MGSAVRLSGSAFLETGGIDALDAGKLAAAIVRSGHSFEMRPTRQGNDWRVEIQIHLEGQRSIQLIEDLKQTGLFST